MRYWLLISIQRFINLLFKLTKRIWKFIYQLDLINEAFWLAVLSKKSLETLLQKHYESGKRYTNNENTLKGLFTWEKEIANKFTPPQSRIIIIAAGGGREAFALAQRSCIVEAYETDKKMVSYAQSVFKDKNLPVTFSQHEINTIPSGTCDVFWFGWGVYTHFIGQENRVQLLVEASLRIEENGYIIISYWRETRSIERINKIQSITQKLKRRKVERGESFRNCMWGKYYTREQIINEATLAQLKVIYISDYEYGHAVLQKQ